jgi:hypothetical protein
MLSIIANPQAEEPAIVGDVHFDAGRLRVLKCISKDLASNPVQLIAKNRGEGLPRSFYGDLE